MQISRYVYRCITTILYQAPSLESPLPSIRLHLLNIYVKINGDFLLHLIFAVPNDFSEKHEAPLHTSTFFTDVFLLEVAWAEYSFRIRVFVLVATMVWLQSLTRPCLGNLINIVKNSMNKN